MAKKLSDTTRPKVARAYIRVSHQGDRGRKPGGGEFLSPQMQLDEARQYAKLFLKDYVFDEDASTLNEDIDTSASRIKWHKRHGLVAHLEAAQRGEFSALIVFKLSRFARNARECLELFELFENTGCSIHCIKDKLDTSDASGRMIRTILLAVSEMESENISDFVKATALTRAQNGLPQGTVPFWISKNENRAYVLNDRVPSIRRLIDLKLEGVANTRIARILNGEGVHT